MLGTKSCTARNIRWRCRSFLSVILTCWGNPKQITLEIQYKNGQSFILLRITWIREIAQTSLLRKHLYFQCFLEKMLRKRSWLIVLEPYFRATMNFIDNSSLIQEAARKTLPIALLTSDLTEVTFRLHLHGNKYLCICGLVQSVVC